MGCFCAEVGRGMVLTDLVMRKRVVGLNQVKRAINRGEAELVIIAKDIEDGIFTELLDVAGRMGVKVELVDSKEMLGKAAGIKRPASSVALLR